MTQHVEQRIDKMLHQLRADITASIAEAVEPVADALDEIKEILRMRLPPPLERRIGYPALYLRANPPWLFVRKSENADLEEVDIGGFELFHLFRHLIEKLQMGQDRTHWLWSYVIWPDSDAQNVDNAFSQKCTNLNKSFSAVAEIGNILERGRIAVKADHFATTAPKASAARPVHDLFTISAEALEAYQNQDWTAVGDRARAMLQMDPKNWQANMLLCAAATNLMFCIDAVFKEDLDRGMVSDAFAAELQRKWASASRDSLGSVSNAGSHWILHVADDTWTVFQEQQGLRVFTEPALKSAIEFAQQARAVYRNAVLKAEESLPRIKRPGAHEFAKQAADDIRERYIALSESLQGIGSQEPVEPDIEEPQLCWGTNTRFRRLVRLLTPTWEKALEEGDDGLIAKCPRQSCLLRNAIDVRESLVRQLRWYDQTDVRNCFYEFISDLSVNVHLPMPLRVFRHGFKAYMRGQAFNEIAWDPAWIDNRPSRDDGY